MRISDWSSDVCSSDLHPRRRHVLGPPGDGDPARQGALLLRRLLPGTRTGRRAPAADARGTPARGPRAGAGNPAREAGHAADQGPAPARSTGSVRTPPRDHGWPGTDSTIVGKGASVDVDVTL